MKAFLSILLTVVAPFLKAVGWVRGWFHDRRIFKAGQDRERVEHLEDAVRKAKERHEIDEDVARMSDDQLDDELRANRRQ